VEVIEINMPVVRVEIKEDPKLDVKAVAQKQAEEAYIIFKKFLRYFSYASIGAFVLLIGCNFGVDGSGGKSDPAYYEEYKSNMGME
tara:strand:- start:2432 stop:2689 length:258 start_codon:yes stop_codon:yes gene_type:complete